MGVCTALLIKYYSDDQEKCDGRSMWHVWETKDVHTGFWFGELREIVHLEDLRSKRTILKQIFKKWDGEANGWTDLAQDGERWRPLVNAVMTLRVP